MVNAPTATVTLIYSDRLGFFLIDHHLAVLTPVVAEEPLERNHGLAIGEPLAPSPGDVERNAPAFLLRQRGHDRNQKLTLGVESPDVLFFKIDLRAVSLEFPDGGKAVHRVPCETADALGQNQPDFPGKGILDHAVEPITFAGGSAADAFVRVPFLSGTFLWSKYCPLSSGMPIFDTKNSVIRNERRYTLIYSE